MSGATAVQFISALMVHGPEHIQEMLRGLETYLKEKNYQSVKEIVGIAAKKAFTYKQLNQIKAVRYTNNSKVCDGCPINFKCLDYCYFEAIKQEEGQVRFLDTCNGCGLCHDICTIPGAISPID
jgi:dihydropyrimidine dehydrogenase (NAD+) subunit PreA